MVGYDHDTVVEVQHLSRNFGKKEALDGVSLRVPKGCVFGLIGENGAGKTTLIRHLLGGLVPQTGRVEVFGINPVSNPTAVLAGIGYLSEDRDLPLWMRVGELMRYTQAFFPDWDAEYAEQLRQEFNLPLKTKIRALSRGEKAKVGLLAALGHKPDLLLLDEPSSGLDAVARRDILSSIVRTVADEGRTVLFSSHLLDEVERVADHVAMIHQGVVTLDLPMDELKQMHHQILIRFDEAKGECPELPGLIHAQGEGQEWRVMCEADVAQVTAEVARHGGAVIEQSVPSLDAVFVARVTKPMRQEAEKI